MKQFLTEQERRTIDQRVADAEKRTGAQIVLAVIERSDTYTELPWKAFALGAALAGLAVVAYDQIRPAWSSASLVLFAVAATLGVGAAVALAAVAASRFGRLFLAADRAEVEARQYAESLFLNRELFATRGRTGILLLVSLFERRVVVLPDRGLSKRLGTDSLQGIIERMTPPLASGLVARALEAGLEMLVDRLATTSSAASGENEIPDEIIQEEGA